MKEFSWKELAIAAESVGFTAINYWGVNKVEEIDFTAPQPLDASDRWMKVLKDGYELGSLWVGPESEEFGPTWEFSIVLDNRQPNFPVMSAPVTGAQCPFAAMTMMLAYWLHVTDPGSSKTTILDVPKRKAALVGGEGSNE